MRVLVTYFAPFGTDTLNASALAAKLLPEELPEVEIRKIELPVAFHGAEEALEAAIKAYSPDLVLYRSGGRHGRAAPGACGNQYTGRQNAG